MYEKTYEKYKIYKINWCDLDSCNALAKTLGKFSAATFKAFDTGCECCSGTRIWFAILIAFALGYSL